jgi:hypothetical protein
MQKLKFGWKVVLNINGRLKSVCRFFHSSVEYKLYQAVEPKRGYGPLCVFRTRRQARRFKKETHEDFVRIYRCVYWPSSKNQVWNQYGYRPIGDLPNGTVLADRVKLLYQA